MAAIKAEKKENKSYGEELKKETELENQKKIEEVHAIKEGALKAKETVIKNKAKHAAIVTIEKKELQRQIILQEKEELARKIQLIQQIKLLELAQNNLLPKEFDLTETSGVGLLGEMSIMEVGYTSSCLVARETSCRKGER